MASGMFYQGKKLSNKEYAALSPKAREEAQTTEEWMKSKAEITKREYTTAGDARLKNLKEALAAGEISPEEYKTAMKSSLGVAPKIKGREKEAAQLNATLKAADYPSLNKNEKADVLAGAVDQASLSNPKYGQELLSDPKVTAAMDRVKGGTDLIELANSDFNGDLDAAAQALTKKLGGSDKAKTFVKNAKSYAKGMYTKKTDRGGFDPRENIITWEKN